MKNPITKVILVCAALSSPAHAADHTIIGISPHQSATEAEEHSKRLILQIAKELEPGDQVEVFDAYTIKSIASFSIAEGKSYGRIQQKLRANKAAVKAMVQFGRDSLEAGETPSGTLRVPKFLHYLSENGLVRADTNIILIGSPIFNDPLAAGHSMNQARVPSDGHISASQRVSPYGVRGIANAFDGARLAFSYEGFENWQKSTAHEYAVKRFWTLLFHEVGLNVVTFGQETDFAFKMLDQSGGRTAADYRLEQTDRLEMTAYVNQRVSVGSIFDRPLAGNPVNTADIDARDGVEIGLRWQCGSCDLDLYVQAHGAVKPLYFANDTSPDGKYYKDYRSAPVTNGYELVDLHGPVDIAQVSIAVNYYSGKAITQPVVFELFLAVDGLTFSREYRLDSAKGNKGAGRSTPLSATPQSAHWQVIRPTDILGLGG